MEKSCRPHTLNSLSLILPRKSDFQVLLAGTLYLRKNSEVVANSLGNKLTVNSQTLGGLEERLWSNNAVPYSLYTLPVCTGTKLP